MRRQYSLPNCTLLLEGLTDNEHSFEVRPPLSILVRTQCTFLGMSQTLEGGRTLLENLAKVVNVYAQECLSGVHRPVEKTTEESDRIELEKIQDSTLHRLTWYPPTELHQAPVAIELSTVQLFDLVEAVDQFIADSQTLPDFSVKLQPTSRRYRQSDDPLAQRAIPATLGLASLAIASFAIYFLPIPTVRKPENTRPIAPQNQTLPPGNNTEPPTGNPRSPKP
ncbi:MAG: DUF4335 domain-containing protein [Microcystaceae cyanobacterium]